MDFLLAQGIGEIFGIATDISVVGGIIIALKIIWGAFRKDKQDSDKREAALLVQNEKLQKLLKEIQDLRVTEAIEREDKTHLVIRQYSSRIQDLVNTISQMQYMIILALKLDPPAVTPLSNINPIDTTDNTDITEDNNAD